MECGFAVGVQLSQLIKMTQRLSAEEVLQLILEDRKAFDDDDDEEDIQNVKTSEISV